jgi:hypothetical protein
MLSYGRLPDGRLMINWPVYANDFYADYLTMNPPAFDSLMTVAKNNHSGPGNSGYFSGCLS